MASGEALSILRFSAGASTSIRIASAGSTLPCRGGPRTLWAGCSSNLRRSAGDSPSRPPIRRRSGESAGFLVASFFRTPRRCSPGSRARRGAAAHRPLQRQTAETFARCDPASLLVRATAAIPEAAGNRACRSMRDTLEMNITREARLKSLRCTGAEAHCYGQKCHSEYQVLVLPAYCSGPYRAVRST